MAAITPFVNAAYKRYLGLLLGRHDLLLQGATGEPVEDLEEEMCDVWHALDEAQRASLNGIGADLAWIRRRGAPPPRGRKPNEVTGQDHWALIQAENAANWHAVLHALRLCAASLRPADLAYRRAVAYAGLGVSSVVYEFVNLASELGISEDQAAHLHQLLARLDSPLQPDPTFTVCWAGVPGPGHPLACLGSTDGRVQLLKRNGELVGPPEFFGSIDAPVTGVSQVAKWLAVATKKEITLLDLSGRDQKQVRRVHLPHGANNLASSSRGRFAAALGTNGFLILTPNLGERQPVTVIGQPGGLDFSRVICIEDGQRELFVCALRSDGIATLDFHEEEAEPALGMFAKPGLDVVDLCPLNAGGSPRGVIGVTADGLICLFEDIFQPTSPLTLSFEVGGGRASRVLSSHGDVYVLTADGVYAFHGVAEQFSRGVLPTSGQVSYTTFGTHGTEMTLAEGRWVFVVTPAGVEVHDAKEVHSSGPQSTDDALKASSKEIAGEWSKRTLKQPRRNLAASTA